jgi:RNA polymerase sigma-70 factor (ECF subfamily)
MTVSERKSAHDEAGTESRWAGLMRAALDGDRAAYQTLLVELAPVLRVSARRGCQRVGLTPADAEDVVQETLLAIHLKRQTWQVDMPIGPWIRAIARNKLIDALRRRSRRGREIDIDDLGDVLAAPPEEDRSVVSEVVKHLHSLAPGQRSVVQAVAVDGASIRDTAQKLLMSEGAVRVALHRGLATLARRLREQRD